MWTAADVDAGWSHRRKLRSGRPSSARRRGCGTSTRPCTSGSCGRLRWHDHRATYVYIVTRTQRWLGHEYSMKRQQREPQIYLESISFGPSTTELGCSSYGDRVDGAQFLLLVSATRAYNTVHMPPGRRLLRAAGGPGRRCARCLTRAPVRAPDTTTRAGLTNARRRWRPVRDGEAGRRLRSDVAQISVAPPPVHRSV